MELLPESAIQFHVPVNHPVRAGAVGIIDFVVINFTIR